MSYLSLIGIILAIAILIYGSIKSVSMILLAGTAAALVTLTGGLGMGTGYAKDYMTGVGGFVTSMMPLFITGAIFGKLMESSGLAVSVANSLLKHIKSDRGIITAIFLTTVILVTAGINVFVIIFAIYPLAVSMLRKANISKNIMPALIMGGASAQALLPGTPSGINVLSAKLAGVTEMAAPITGILSFLVLAIMSLLYFYKVVKKMKFNGELFVATERDSKYLSGDVETLKLPSPWLIVPPIAAVLIFLNVFHWPAYLALLVGSAILLVTFNRKYTKLKEIFNDAAQESQYIVITAAIVGFGSVIKNVPGFQVVSDMLDRISGGNPYIFAFIAINILAAVCGSSMGGISVAVAAWGDKLLAAGVNPQSMARLFTVSSMGMDSLPFNSANLLAVKYCDVDARQGHKHLFIVTCIFGTVVGIIPVITATLGII